MCFNYSRLSEHKLTVVGKLSPLFYGRAYFLNLTYHKNWSCWDFEGHPPSIPSLCCRDWSSKVMPRSLNGVPTEISHATRSWNIQSCALLTLSAKIHCLTPYTPTSVCIFSILFSIHLPRCWQGELCLTIKSSFSLWSFLLFSWLICLIQLWCCKEKLTDGHSKLEEGLSRFITDFLADKPSHSIMVINLKNVLTDMAREAGTAALNDAGISYQDVEAVVASYCYGEPTSGVIVILLKNATLVGHNFAFSG